MKRGRNNERGHNNSPVLWPSGEKMRPLFFFITFCASRFWLSTAGVQAESTCCVASKTMYYYYTDMHVFTALHPCVAFVYRFILALVHQTHLFALYNQVSRRPRGPVVPRYTGPRSVPLTRFSSNLNTNHIGIRDQTLGSVISLMGWTVSA